MSKNASVIACVLADVDTPFTDNVKGLCSHCGVAIQWRAHHSPAIPKICIRCCADLVAQDPAPRFVLSKNVVEDLRAFIKRQRH